MTVGEDADYVADCNRSHFFGVAAGLMREILVDHARAQRASKRGGGADVLTMEEAGDVAQPTVVDVPLMDDALDELARLDERQSRIAELRFFRGCPSTKRQILSPATVSREWTNARAWLHRELSRKSVP